MIMKKQLAHKTFKAESQAGITVLETMIALTILLVALVGIMGLVSLSMTTTEDQGHLMARCTEYAQDKMEQLNSLSYGDSITDTTVFPAASSGGTGLTIGGSSDPTNPTASYVDYLNVNGDLTTSQSQWYYIRVWKVEAPAGTTNLKQITVTAMVSPRAGAKGQALQSTVVSLKSSPF
jgi:hypothetical protein